MNKNIVVIGAGTMGNGIAHVFAQNNFTVDLVDVNKNSLTKSIRIINKNLDRLIEKNKITVEVKELTLNNITTHLDIKSSKKDSFIVIEVASENLDLKLNIFEEADKYYNQNTILATNTSSISITKIASATKRSDKVIGMHFMNPVPIMKLVEIIKGYDTSQKTLIAVEKLTEDVGKIPVEVNDYPGFIANRILLPMINEAIESLHHGVGTIKSIDSIMKLGMGHPMGPLQLADFIGLDICLSILEVMYKGFCKEKYAPSPLLVKMVDAGKLGVKSGEGFYDYSKTKKAEFISNQFKS
jgi:3-hydroxybutyryl-CoA dehydrogenase